MAFTAKFGGQCGECHGDIEPGDMIESGEGRLAGTYVHVDCEAPASVYGPAVVRELAEPIRIFAPIRNLCPECFLEKPCPCEDGQ